MSYRDRTPRRASPDEGAVFPPRLVLAMNRIAAVVLMLIGLWSIVQHFY